MLPEGVRKLPKLNRSQTEPSILQDDTYDNLAIIERLQGEIRTQQADRERLRERVKDLETKLRRSSPKISGKNRFGITKPNPYKSVPVPPPALRTPQRTRGLQLPSLRTIPNLGSPPPRVFQEQAAETAAHGDMEIARDPDMSRAERSAARIRAIRQLEGAGLNSWKERKAEKVARLNDLTIFRDSMWGSFREWNEEYNLKSAES